jgi:hypothetical protein
VKGCIVVVGVEEQGERGGHRARLARFAVQKESRCLKRFNPE